MSSLKPTCTTPEQLDIYVKRILAKYAAEEQIFFESRHDQATDKDRKIPVSICIHNKGNATIKCINEVKIADWETSQEIICNHKARLTIRFKIALWVKYSDNSFGLIVLPDDNPALFCYIDANPFPATIGTNESLSIQNGYFVWVLDVPFSKFDDTIPPEAFDDPTIQSHLLIKAVRPEFDILNACTCPATPHPIPGTKVTLAIFADILDKLGVDQDILIEGIPIDC